MTAADIRAARARLGWSMQRLADALDVSKTTVANWEGGDPVRHPGMLRLALERLVDLHVEA